MIPIDKAKIIRDIHEEGNKGDEGDGFPIAHTTDVTDRLQILFILAIIIGCFLEKR